MTSYPTKSKKAITLWKSQSFDTMTILAGGLYLYTNFIISTTSDKSDPDSLSLAQSIKMTLELDRSRRIAFGSVEMFATDIKSTSSDGGAEG